MATSSLSTAGGTITDAAGNAAVLTLAAPGAAGSLGANKNIIIDTTAPAAPVISAPANNVYTASSSVTVSGTAEASSTVILKDSGTTVGTVTATGGNWSVALTGVADGAHTYTATSTDAAGNISSGSTVVVNVDTAPPAAPAITNLPMVTNSQKPTIAGTTEANATINVYSAGSTAFCSTTASGAGAWSCAPASNKSDAVYAITAKATDAAGNISSASSAGSLTINTATPIVTGVTTSTANGSYTSGITVSLLVSFSTVINVTGSPQLQMSLGGNNPYAVYVSGSGTNTLTFQFTTAAGQFTTNTVATAPYLDYLATTALTLNSGTIKDAALNAATLSLPVPGAAGSLSANASIIVDALPATVTSVTSTLTNGSYGVGRTVPITVTFNKILTVTGTPKITLNTTPSQTANYVSSTTTGTNYTGTTTMTFNYVVVSGDVSTTLDYASTSALALNGGTILDWKNNAATLTLVAPNATGSISAAKSIAITGNNNTTPSLTYSPSTNYLFTGSAATQSYLTIGTAYNWTWSESNAAAPITTSYSCYYDQFLNNTVAATNLCTSLPGTATFNTSTGVFAWTPSSAAYGPYEISVKGTNSAGAGSASILQADVRPAYSTANLRGDYDAQFSNASVPATGTALTWYDISGNGYTATNSNSTNAAWAAVNTSGSVTTSSPYSIAYNGSGYTTLGSSLTSSQTKVMFNTWVNPSSPTSLDKVLLDDSTDLTGTGFTLRQSASVASKIELATSGSYRSVVLADSPTNYWRLGESSGTSAADLGSSATTLTYTGSPTLGVAGALSSATNTSVTFNGTSQYVVAPNNTLANFERTNTFSGEAWIKTGAAGNYIILGKMANSVPYAGWVLGILNGKLYLQPMNTWNSNLIEVDSTGSFTDNLWHHVAFTYDGTSSASGVKLYADGVQLATTTVFNTLSASMLSSTIPFQIGGRNGANVLFTGSIQEVALYGSVLSLTRIKAHYDAGKHPYVATVLADSPTNYWRLNELAGTAAYDLGSGATTLAYTGSPTLGATGALSNGTNTSVTFNGTSQYVVAPNNTIANYDRTNTFSGEAWVKISTVIYNPTIMGKMTNSGTYLGWAFNFDNSVGRLYFYLIKDASNNWMSVSSAASTYADGAWHHVAFTYDGSSSASGVKMYVDGVQITTTTSQDSLTSSTLNASVAFAIASRGGANALFPGSIQDVALYSTVLSADRIKAHYNARYGNCLTSKTFAANTWYNIQGIMDGSTASLFVNGQQECATAMPNALTPSTTLTFGATSSGTKGWSGSMADIKIYGTSDGSSVGTSSTVTTNYNATSARYTPTAVTSGLVMQLDAAMANKTNNYANGCAGGNLSWFDLSTTALTATLTNFSSCGSTTGWNGDGTTTISGAAGPYRLTFDGVDDYVPLAITPSTFLGQQFTIEAWVYPTAIGNYRGIAGDHNTGCSGCGIYFGQNNQAATPAGWGFGYGVGGNAFANGVQLPNSSIPINSWTHVVGVFKGSNYIKVYINGTLSLSSTETLPVNHSAFFNIGRAYNTSDRYFQGSMGPFRAYNRELSVSEISQNCKANQARFAGVTCN